jgi:hypothetical protein
VTPGTASVSIQGVTTGASGNVAANTITVIPMGFSQSLLKVTNAEATTGGAHTETKVVKQSDYDAAVAALQKALQQSFASWLASNPEGAGGKTVRLDATATLDGATFDTAAADVVGKEVDTFGMVGQAAGRVLTVDTTLIDAVAAARFRSGGVPVGYTLIDSSVVVQRRQLDSADPALPRFEATVSGSGYRDIDATAIKRIVMGKPLAEARAALSTYGDATVTLSPAWFGTIPQLDWRVSVEVRPPPGAA